VRLFCSGADAKQHGSDETTPGTHAGQQRQNANRKKEKARFPHAFFVISFLACRPQ
jgi:hypothetical protein